MPEPAIDPLARRKQQLRSLLAERYRLSSLSPSVKDRCVTCQRVRVRWEDRRCRLCYEHDEIFGIDAPYAGGEREYTKGAVGSTDPGDIDAGEKRYLDLETYAAAVFDGSEDDVITDIERDALTRNPFRLSVCRAYIECKGNVSATARKVGRDQKTVRHHIAQYRDRLDAMIEGEGAAERHSELRKSNARIVSRGELYGFGSDGKRIPKPTNHFEMPCNYCGTKRKHCVGKCCSQCWHPHYIRIRETRFGISRG